MSEANTNTILYRTDHIIAADCIAERHAIDDGSATLSDHEERGGRIVVTWLVFYAWAILIVVLVN